MNYRITPKTNPFSDEFDWFAALEEAKRINLSYYNTNNSNGDLNVLDALDELARGWPTCACGQLCKRLNKDANGGPADDKLESLGINFQIAVENGDWERAIRIFHLIEQRTTELLKEQANA